METGSQIGERGARPHALDDSGDHRRGIQDTVGDIEIQRGGGVSVAGQMLQLDRGLPFVADLLTYAEQACHRIEQSAHAGGADAAETARDLLAKYVQRGFVEARHRRQLARPLDTGPVQEIQRGAGWVTDRTVAARQCELPQVADPGEVRSIGDRQKFTAPRWCRRCRSRCRHR